MDMHGQRLDLQRVQTTRIATRGRLDHFTRFITGWPAMGSLVKAPDRSFNVRESRIPAPIANDQADTE